jgi:23S rRNA pseudouridine1911/1915/1917 synthase
MPEVSTEIQSTERRARPLPEEGPLSIVFEDEWLIVLDKPPGIVVHPTYKNWSGTLLNSVLWRVRDRVGAQPGILTRLDKDTSGLVVMALTPEVHAAMQRDQTPGACTRTISLSCRERPSPRSEASRFRSDATSPIAGE